MTDNTKNSYYQLSLNILKALGGDTSISFPDADAIWDEIYKIYDHSGGRFDIVPLEKTITENGQYDYYPDNNADAFMPVNLTINVPQKYTDEQVAEIENVARQDGYNTGYSSGFIQGETEGYSDGFSEGLDEGYSDGVIAQKEKLESITLTDNGTYTKEDGWDEVTVEVEGVIPDEELQQMLQEAMDEGYQDGYSEGVDDGREEQKQELESVTFRENGTYTREDGWNEVAVDVEIPTFETQIKDVTITSNGNVNIVPDSGFDGLSKVNISVEVSSSGGGKPKIYNGFRLLSTDSTLSSTQRLTTKLKEVDFTQYDWSGVYDLTEFFGGFRKDSAYSANAFVDSDFDNFRAGFNGRIVCCDNLFKTAPGASSNYTLREVPDFSMFTDNLVSMDYAFCGSELITADNITKWNTRNVVSMNGLFQDCSKLTSIPSFDTSNVIDMSSMFRSCSKLKSVPDLDYSNAVIIDQLFAGCTSLTSIPDLDISSAIYFATGSSTSWINGASNITSIGALQCDNIEDIYYMFGGSSNTKITHFGGAINLGKRWTLNNSSGNYAFNYVPNLTYESVLNVLNGLYDRASAGMTNITLKLHPNHLAMLSDEDIAIATNKGWILS